MSVSDAAATARFALGRDLDIEPLRRRYLEQGYVHVPGILRDDAAAYLHRVLTDQTRWNFVFNDRDKHYDLSQAQIDALPPGRIAELTRAIHGQARTAFQYCYNNYPIYDAMHAGIDAGHPLHAFLQWLNDDPFLGIARQLTGRDDISHADAQATSYGPGHFLTSHDDSAVGKHRRAAYVFGFTPEWRVDWGGILQFIGPDGHVRTGLCPTFNSLNVLAVPQAHNVSIVAPFAGAVRLSITGWLRYGPPPHMAEGMSA